MKLRPAYMVYPGLYPLLMMNYWVKRSQTPIVGILISDYDIKYKGKFLSFPELVLGLIQQCGVAYTWYMLCSSKLAVPMVRLWNWLRRLSGRTVKIRTYEQIAKEQGIPIFRTKDFNGPETKAFIKNIDANIIVSAYNNQILKPVIFNVPEHKTINIHPALLPNFRGLDGPFEAMYHQVPYAGVTIHYVDSRIDTGKIIVQKPVRIRANDTLFSLSARCWMHGAKLLEQVFEQIRTGTVKTQKQNPKEVKYPYRSFPDKTRITEYLNSGKRLFTFHDILNTFKE